MLLQEVAKMDEGDIRIEIHLLCNVRKFLIQSLNTSVFVFFLLLLL